MKGYIGIDLSLTSPGLCLNYENHYEFFFFSHLKKHEDFCYNKDNIYIHSVIYPIESNGDDLNKRVNKYYYIVDNIMNTIQIFAKDLDNIEIGIEGYSYSSVGQGLTKLAELGGILRYEIFKNNFKLAELQPGEIKKHFTGCGNCTKFHMQKQFQSLNIIDFFRILDLKESKALNIPHPIEDLIDSFAIICLLKNEKIKHVNIVDSILDYMK